MRHLILLVLCLFSFAVAAQKAPMKWGKIPQEHLDMTIYKADSSANAVVLCDYGTTSFEIGGDNLKANFYRHTRIKLLDQAAIEEYGDVVIRHFEDEPVFGLKANVIQPDGTITSLGKKDWFTEKVSDDVEHEKISLPQLKPGCIIEYKYQMTDNSWTSIPSWRFQREIPTLHSELRVDMPEWLVYVEMVQGDQLIKRTANRHSAVLSGYSVDMELKTFIATNVSALKREPFISTMNDYRMGIKFQLKQYQPSFALWQTYMTSWEDIAEALMKDQYFGEQYLKRGRSSMIARDIAPKLTNLGSTKEKITAIYGFVNKEVKTKDGGHPFYASKSVDEVYRAREGTVAEKNLMILALLKANNIPAFPVLLSTRSNGKSYPFYPYSGQFDHMMACVMIDDKPFYLDAGSNYRPAGLPRVDALNRTILSITENPDWIDLVPAKSNDIILANLKVDLEGNMTGDFTANSSAYSAVSERIDLNDSSAKEIWTERLVEKYPDAEVLEATAENQKEIYKPLQCKMDVSISGAAQVSGDFIYISPIFYTTFDENPFKLEKRDFPVDMPYPFKEQLIYNFEVPDGYVLDGVPENANVVIPEKGGKFQFLVSQTDNKVQVICKLIINKTYYNPDEYYQIKQLFDVFMEKAGEQLVLKKA